jgi:hypothetical protein
MNRWIVYASISMLCACTEEKTVVPDAVQSEADAIRVGHDCVGEPFSSDHWIARRDGDIWHVFVSDPRSGNQVVLEVRINAHDGQIRECTTRVR